MSLFNYVEGSCYTAQDTANRLIYTPVFNTISTKNVGAGFGIPAGNLSNIVFQSPVYYASLYQQPSNLLFGASIPLFSQTYLQGAYNEKG